MENSPKDSTNLNPQQPIYIQLPYGNSITDTDEINLADLWFGLVKQKWVFLIVPCLFGLIAFIYVQFIASSTKVYEAKTLFSPPLQSDVLPFSQGGETKISPTKLFKQFSVSLLSRKNQSDFFDQFNLLEKITAASINSNQTKKKPSAEAVYNGFHNSMFITLSEAIEAKGEIVQGNNKARKTSDKERLILARNRLKNPKNSKIQQITLSIKGKNPQLISDLLNGFGAYAERKTISQQINDLKKQRELKISGLLNKIEQLKNKTRQARENNIIQIEEQDRVSEKNIKDKLRVLRAKAKTKRFSEIKRLTEVDRLTESTIKEKIAEFRILAEIHRLDKITQLKEALIVAKNLGIKSPSYISFNYSRATAQGDLISNSNTSAQSFALTEINQQNKALYLKGEDTLKEEINSLENRQSNDPFIPKLRTLQGKLRQLKTNAKINILKTRVSDDPFIPEIPELQQELTLLKHNRQLEALRIRTDDTPFIKDLIKLELQIKHLNEISYDKDKVRAAIITQHAFPSKQSINKSKKTVIILASLSLGFVASFFVALILNINSRKASKETSEI